MVKAVNGLKGYLAIWVPDGDTGNTIKRMIPQIRTIPDIGGTPAQILATTKESRVRNEYISGLMDQSTLTFVAVPAPRQADGSDVISIMNELKDGVQYQFEVGIPQMGYIWRGTGEASIILSGTTNDDLQELQINIIVGSLTPPVPVDIYEVSYDVNGNAGIPPVDPFPYQAGDNATILDGDGIRSGSDVFKSWNTEPDGSGSEYEPGDTMMVVGNITLYAQVGQ